MCAQLIDKCSNQLITHRTAEVCVLTEQLTLCGLQATPHLSSKRKSLHGRIRPKSVMDKIDGMSADDIPDLLPSLPTSAEGLSFSLNLYLYCYENEVVSQPVSLFIVEPTRKNYWTDIFQKAG